MCTHCSVAGVPLDANFLYCEVLGCPAAYHEYCVDAAVAAAVAKQPALLERVVLCPLCSITGFELGEAWDAHTTTGKRENQGVVVIDANINLVNNLDLKTISNFRAVANSHRATRREMRYLPKH